MNALCKTLNVPGPGGENVELPIRYVHTLVIGSGAAGLNAAVQLKAAGVDNMLVVTEGLNMGTSINTGSDKQTYYKLSLCGDQADSPVDMAKTYFDGGAMHGDLALVEAALSARAFLNLVNFGVPFPRDAFGQFVGYKTDHDPRQRATSIGPYTSREMCRALIRQVELLGVEVLQQRNVVELLTSGEGDSRRAVGAVVVDGQGNLELFGAENVVFATGGPGGLYKTSVYPQVHTGGIGLALRAGAMAQNLPESQFGMASTKFRWNVSGTFMQVIPRVISTAADGESDAREFLGEHFDSPRRAASLLFLKGYQWPFDSRKVQGGSSIIDILVYIETVVKGRRVFLDFHKNPAGFQLEQLDAEALEYLTNSGALQETPIERLRRMNPAAIELYAEHDIDIATEPLEIAVCAQHNNGGLAANHWWESLNVKHLFPIGEVNGSHGLYRPGGSALNSGQVGSLRAAEFIANRYADRQVSEETIDRAATATAAEILAWLEKSARTKSTWQSHRERFQARMSAAAAHIRSAGGLRKAVEEAWRQYEQIERDGCGCGCSPGETGGVVEALRNRQLCLAHAVYLDAVLFAVESGCGSRGSALVVDPAGEAVDEKLGDDWRMLPEDTSFRAKVQQTQLLGGGEVENTWIARRPIPQSDPWFETAWAKFREGTIYED